MTNSSVSLRLLISASSASRCLLHAFSSASRSIMNWRKAFTSPPLSPFFDIFFARISTITLSLASSTCCSSTPAPSTSSSRQILPVVHLGRARRVRRSDQLLRSMRRPVRSLSGHRRYSPCGSPPRPHTTRLRHRHEQTQARWEPAQKLHKMTIKKSSHSNCYN